MIFPDGDTKEGYFENNVYRYAIGGSHNPGNSGVHSISNI